MKISDLKSAASVDAERALDPQVRAELDRTAVAEQIALLVAAYRAEHGLTQTALARELGMQQSAVARLEAGTHQPSLATLARLSTVLGIHLNLDITPDAVSLRSA
jgi:ribosome-binding protein aMBF1 (putative translation factor)